MVGFIPVPQAKEDLDRLLPAGLPDGHRLEAALQGRVLFDVAPVFIQGGGPHHLDLPPG